MLIDIRSGPMRIRAAGFRGGATWDTGTQFVGSCQETVAYTGAFLLVADLFKNIGQQVFCVLVGRFRIDKLVKDLLGKAVLAVIIKRLALCQDRFGTAHHLYIKRGRGLR